MVIIYPGIKMYCMYNIKYYHSSLIKKREDAKRVHHKRDFDEHHKARDIKPLSSGAAVFVTDMT